MHKKTIEKKKHYRRINNKIKHFNIHNDGWYNHWHTHLDWTGYANRSRELRIKHINYYLELLDKIEEQTDKELKFQTWVLIYDIDSAYDAVYFHTKNPHSDFPTKFDNFEWIDNLPEKYQTLDLDKYRVGKIDSEDICYIIQKKGLGISLST